MAYDERLAQPVRGMLGQRPGYVEKPMLGGVGFLLHGNVSCGVIEEELIVRVGRWNRRARPSAPSAILPFAQSSLL